MRLRRRRDPRQTSFSVRQAPIPIKQPDKQADKQIDTISHFAL
jgi:hypothetical protein